MQPADIFLIKSVKFCKPKRDKERIFAKLNELFPFCTSQEVLMQYIFVLFSLQPHAPQVRSLQLAWLHVHCVTAVPFSPMVRVACVSNAQEQQ